VKVGSPACPYRGFHKLALCATIPRMRILISLIASVTSWLVPIGIQAGPLSQPQVSRTLEERIGHLSTLEEGTRIAAELKGSGTLSPFFTTVERVQGKDPAWRLQKWMLEAALPILELCGEIGSPAERRTATGWMTSDLAFAPSKPEQLRWYARVFLALIPEADFGILEAAIARRMDLYAKEHPRFSGDGEREAYAREYQEFSQFLKTELPRWVEEARHRRQILALQGAVRRHALETMVKSPTGPVPEASARWAAGRLLH
jgi:hypothetical protein